MEGQHYQAVALVLQGYPYTPVSQIIGRSLAIISHDIQAYRSGGLAALEPGHSSGRHHRLTAEQEHTLAEIVIHQTPQDVDLPAQRNWTGPLVRRLIT